MKLIDTNQKWLPLFIDFLGYLSVETKDYGVIQLKDKLFGAQTLFLEHICHGLDNDTHQFVFLKARQLGISTLSLALDLFWLMVHDNTQGALICDTDGNRDRFRLIIDKYIESLPKTVRVGVSKHNRTCLVLENGSVLDYMVAGVRKNKNLGRGRALNFLHATETSSWGDPDAVSSLMATLSEKHPDRLYIFESTANGMNLFWDMWNSAKEDEINQKACFIGWWAKESYKIERNDPNFKKYYLDDPEMTEEESEKVRFVKDNYGVGISPEQLAWSRWKRSTMSSDAMMSQEFPWTADEAFVSTGSSFFPRKIVSQNIKFIIENNVAFYGMRYEMSDTMAGLRVVSAQTRDESELRIWEEPHKDGRYVIGFDPSYGGSDNSDNHSIQVFRCFADKMVQVAEYTACIPETYQVAWVLAHLAAVYKNCIINLEVFGPGKAIMQELSHQKQLISMGKYSEISGNPELLDALSSAKWYMYSRPDTPGTGYAYNFSTTQDNKLTILTQMRDCYSTKQLEIRSVPLLNEMLTMEQDGYSVHASGRNKDDRVMATAFALKAWVDWVRPSMIAMGQTMRYELDRIERMAGQQESPFHQQMITGFFSNVSEAEERRRIEQIWGEV